MRRSKMIEALTEPIIARDVELHLWPSEAEAILERIEELGMLPPRKNELETEVWKLAWEDGNETQS